MSNTTSYTNLWYPFVKRWIQDYHIIKADMNNNEFFQFVVWCIEKALEDSDEMTRNVVLITCINKRKAIKKASEELNIPYKEANSINKAFVYKVGRLMGFKDKTQ